MISEKALSVFTEDKRRRLHLWIRKSNDLLYSVAYRSLDYAPALKVYDWARMKDRIESKADKRARMKCGLPEPAPQPFSFTFDEAEYFGLTRKQFARALRELHAVGIVDVVKKGSGRHKDFSLFVWSERWRRFDTDKFEAIPFPRNQRHLPRNADGTWISTRHTPKNSSPHMADLRNKAENSPCENTPNARIKGKETPLKEGLKGKNLPLVKSNDLPLKIPRDLEDVDSEFLVADDLEWVGV